MMITYTEEKVMTTFMVRIAMMKYMEISEKIILKEEPEMIKFMVERSLAMF